MYNWPQRKNQRLKNYDYSRNWFYFVTICTKNREDFFWEIIKWKIYLNEYGNIVEKFWNEIIKHYENVKIDDFIIMPNHIHGIIILVGNEYFRSVYWNNNQIKGSENINSIPNLSNIIKWFKIWCTKEIRNKYNDFIFWWQKSFFDVIIQNDEQLEKTRQYIINNPLKWELDVNNKKNEDLVKKNKKRYINKSKYIK